MMKNDVTLYGQYNIPLEEISEARILNIKSLQKQTEKVYSGVLSKHSSYTRPYKHCYSGRLYFRWIDTCDNIF